MTEEEFWEWVKQYPQAVGLALQETRRVLQNLVAGIARCEPAWNNAIVMAHVHGSNYPPEEISIEQELNAARALIAESE